MKDINKIKNLKRESRQRKIRKKITGTAQCPRFNVFKSNQGIYLQLIDDVKGVTLVSAHLKEVKPSKAKNKKDDNPYFELGKLTAEKAMKKKIKQVVFDRGGYRYHGKVKSVAEGARSAGLKF